MHNQDHLNHINHNKNIWNSISEIQNICGLIDYDIAEVLGISTDEFKSRKYRNCDLSTFEVLKISQKFHLDIHHLYNNQFDKKIVEDRFNGVNSTMASRYSENPFSKKRTQMNILSYIEDNFYTLLDSCYKRFQLNEDCFKNQDESINIKFLEDLCNYLAHRGFSSEDFYKMGLHSYEVNKDSPFGKSLSHFKNVSDLFSFITEEFSHKYDLNFDYKYRKLSSREILIEETPTKLAQEVARGNIGNELTTLVKTGVMASIPSYIEQEVSDIEVIKSIHRGDSTTEFLIHL